MDLLDMLISIWIVLTIVLVMSIIVHVDRKRRRPLTKEDIQELREEFHQGMEEVRQCEEPTRQSNGKN